jgi:RHS repeat-associated protein
MRASGVVSNYFADQIGSANVVTNATGAMPPEQDIEYHPYGEQQVYTDTLGQRYLFTGHEDDPETNDDYFGAREYSSTFGRFLTPDWSATPVPIPYAVMGNPQTLNLYSYVENNPITGTDPDGHGDPPASDQPCDSQCIRDRKLKAWIEQAKADLQSAGATIGGVSHDFYQGYLNSLVSLSSMGLAPKQSDGVPITHPDAEAAGALFLGIGTLFIPSGGKTVALDTNALIAAIEHPTTAEGQAVLKAINGREISVSITAVKEFLVKGDSQALREFLVANNGHVAKAAPAGVVRALKAVGLKDKDARVVGSALAEGLRVLTNDHKTIVKKVPGLTEPI